MFGSNKPYNPLLSEPVLKVAATESVSYVKLYIIHFM